MRTNDIITKIKNNQPLGTEELKFIEYMWTADVPERKEGMTMFFCPNCNALISMNQPYCSSCGKKIKKMRMQDL